MIHYKLNRHDREMERQACKQTDRQTDRQTVAKEDYIIFTEILGEGDDF